MVKPSVGVVMAVRNGADTIAAAVGSVLVQQPPIERIVVVDGGSTDGTLDRLPADDRVMVVAQRSVGLGAARNDGVRMLSTDLVGFCDADDRWRPGSLAARLDHLAANLGCDAVAGRVRTSVDPAVGEAPAHRRAGLGRPVAGYTPGAVLIRRARVAPFDEDLRIAADAAWFAQLIDSPTRLDLIDDVVLDKGVAPSTLSNDLAAYRRELLVVVSELVARRRPRPAGHDEPGRGVP